MINNIVDLYKKLRQFPVDDIVLSNALSLAPHAETVRSSYTIPSASFAEIIHVYMASRALTAAAGNNIYGIGVKVTRATGKSVNIIELKTTDEANYEPITSTSNPFILLNPLDKIEVVTFDDASTGVRIYDYSIALQVYKMLTT